MSCDTFLFEYGVDEYVRKFNFEKVLTVSNMQISWKKYKQKLIKGARKLLQKLLKNIV